MDLDDAGQRARTTALKAGWICLAAGAPLAWKVYTFHVLFLVAIGLGATAMATRQIRWGLSLVLASIFTSVTSMKVADYLLARELEAMFKPLAQQIDRNVAQITSAMSKAVSSAPHPTFSLPPRVTVSTPSPAPAPTRSIHEMDARELLAEISRLEELQRASRKAGRAVPTGTTDKLLKVQSAYDALTARNSR